MPGLVLGGSNLDRLLAGALNFYLGAWTCGSTPGLVLGGLDLNRLLAGAAGFFRGAWTCSCTPGLVLGGLSFQFEQTSCWGCGLQLRSLDL